MDVLRRIGMSPIPWEGNQRKWIAAIASLVLGVLIVWALQPPGSLEEAERHLDRDVVAFVTHDGTPYAAVRVSGEIRFNQMIEGPPRLAWPPNEHWILDEPSARIPSRHDPATAGRSYQDGRWMIFGEIRTSSIVMFEYRIDGVWIPAPASAPGFIVVLDEDLDPPTRVRWLDANGEIVWEQSIPE